MTMKDTLESIASRFAVEGRVATVSPLGQGFINRTYFVTVEGSDEPGYILQAKNHLVFPDVPAMMDNIDRVTRHIKAKVADPLRETLTIIPTLEGSLYYKDELALWSFYRIFIYKRTYCCLICIFVDFCKLLT